MKQFARNHEQAAFQFGGFELDPRAGELRKHGIKLKLQQQPLQILTILLERPGEIVTREEIKKRLWPDDTYVDFDNAINSAMRKLRDALGDIAENPRFIETLSRRGYRLIYPISGGGRLLSAAQPKGAGSRHGHWWAGLSAFLVVTIGLSFWIAESKNKMRVPETPGIYRFTSYPGVETMPAFSPDGKEIAYVRAEHDPFVPEFWRRQAGQANIYTKLVGAGTELRLTNHAGADYYPAWSRDGQYIAFYRDEPGASGFYIVSALGGEERRITYEKTQCAGIAWLPDGRHLVVSHVFEWPHPALVEISLDTGKQRRITFPPAETVGDAWPAVSPDGMRLAFVRLKNTKEIEVCFARLSGTAPRCRPLQGNWAEGLAWTASGDGIIVSVMSTGPYQLWRYHLDGGTPEALTSGEEDAALPTSSRQGNRLAYVLYRQNAQLWELSLHSSEINPADAQPIASSSRTESDPALSPDGRKIASLSDRSGSVEIWIVDTDTHASTQLTHFEGPPAGSPSWSPDGRQIAFDSNPGGGRTNIFVISTDGGEPRRITTSPAENCVPSWSLDGKSIYFTSDRSGKFQIWMVSAATGETASHPAVQVTHGGGFRAVESADGKYLYYARGRGQRGLWRRNLLDGKEEPVLESLQEWGWWALAPRSIYFFEVPRSVHPQVHLKAFDIAERRTRELGTVRYPVMSATATIAVSRDGRHLAYTQINSTEADIMLMANVR